MSTKEQRPVPKRQDYSDGQLLRTRAASCRLLAMGAGDPQFTKILNSIAEEYEAKAAFGDGTTQDI